MKYKPEKWLSHTRMRFDTLGIQALWLRMGKVKNLDKLMAFSIVADERGHMDLSIAAKARLAQLTGDQSFVANLLPKPKSANLKKSGKRLKRRLDI